MVCFCKRIVSMRLVYINSERLISRVLIWVVEDVVIMRILGSCGNSVMSISFNMFLIMLVVVRVRGMKGN